MTACCPRERKIRKDERAKIVTMLRRRAMKYVKHSVSWRVLNDVACAIEHSKFKEEEEP